MLHSVRFAFLPTRVKVSAHFDAVGDVFSVTVPKVMQRLNFKSLADFTNATNPVHKMQQDARADQPPPSPTSVPCMSGDRHIL